MKMILLLSALCLVLGVTIGLVVERRLNPVQVYDCEVIDYRHIEQIIAKQVQAHPVQGLDVEKIKHVKSFTYAPVYYLSLHSNDSLFNHLVPNLVLNPKPR